MACGAKILFILQNKNLIKIKILYDAHQFFDQSTVQMVTYVFLPVECIKYVQTMHNQFLSSFLLRVDLNPLKQKATSSQIRNVMIDFPTLFLKWYQKHVKIRFSYLLWHDNFCKGPRTLRKFPQNCQKIAGC